jgi:hypothetical protein
MLINRRDLGKKLTLISVASREMSAFSPLSFCSEARNSFSLPTLAYHIIEERNLVRKHSMRSHNLDKGYFFIKEVMFHISLIIFIFRHVLRSPVTNECKMVWLQYILYICSIQKNITKIIFSSNRWN